MEANNGKLWAVINNGEIEIRSVTRADLEESLDILDKSFFINEPVCNACEINLPENSQARAELRELCRITAEDGVSLIAKNVASGKVVAVSFNKIQYIPENNEDPFFLDFRKKSTHSPQAQRLMDFMISVDEGVDVLDVFKMDCVNELMFLATLPECERKGIGRALAQYTIEMTRKLSNGIGVEIMHQSLRGRRPRAVTAIWSSHFSQKVGKSLCFTVLNTESYDKFSYNGKTFDQRINPMHKFAEQVVLVL